MFPFFTIWLFQTHVKVLFFAYINNLLNNVKNTHGGMLLLVQLQTKRLRFRVF